MSDLSDRVAALEGLVNDLIARHEYPGRMRDAEIRDQIDRAARITLSGHVADDFGSAAAALAAAKVYTDSAVAGAAGTRNLNAQTAPVNSAANGSENDLMTYTVAAGKLAANGDRLTGRAVFFANAAAPASRQIRFYFGGTVIWDSGALGAWTSSSLALEFEIVRVGATTSKASVTASADFGSISSVPQRTSITATLSGTVVVKATSQQGPTQNVGDVTQASMTIDYTPGAP